VTVPRTVTHTRWQCPPKTILVGVDFGEASARALAIAKVLAFAFQAHLRALHAERFEPPPFFTIDQITRLEEERHAALTAATDHLARFAAASAYQVESLVVDEPPVEAILDNSADADLIVLGTHGRRGPGRWWLGSVAERVVRAAAVPVLVTRAGSTPPLDVFERVALVLDGAPAEEITRNCATRLAGIGSGALIEAGTIAQCDANALRQATLIMMVTRHDRPSLGLTDPVARVLGSCERPVLFVPGGVNHTEVAK
jgi:nucleotide-binding universal stress UspA family protein